MSDIEFSGCRGRFRGLGAIAGIFFALVLGAVIMFVIFSGFKSSDVYKEALSRAQSDPRVVEALGTPIQAGLFVTGSLETQGISGDAQLNIPIHGPKGRGVLYAAARRENGVWNFYTLAVGVNGQDALIPLDK